VSGLELYCILPPILMVAAVSGTPALPSPYIYTAAQRYDAAAPRTGGERFPAGAVLHLVSNGRDAVLIPGFASTADASVSFDGARVLFSGKQKPADRWQIWEAPLAGGTPRRVVAVPDDCITPFYLPADRVVFARRSPQGFGLQIASIAGGYVFPLTYIPGNQIVNDVLRDGRVLFEGAHPGGAAAGIRDLYTVYTDGSGVETHRCDHTHDRHTAREVASGDIVFETGGKLARFTSARAVEVPIAQPAGEFAGPVAELPDGTWLVSWHRSPSSPLALYRWSPGEPKIQDLLAAGAVQPVLVAARPRPKIHPSGLGNREGANTLCLNVYTSRLRIAEGSVEKVRVWARDDRGAAVALGTARVESDGSFFLTTPADRGVRFELLDGTGKTVAAEKGWFWYRRGEQRVCVGCHAGPERAADNVQPMTLLRSTDPVRFALPGGAK
jgi:hypothetical protein